jgi:hypothetical protein
VAWASCPWNPYHGILPVLTGETPVTHISWARMPMPRFTYATMT